jgi:hypothetical protein
VLSLDQRSFGSDNGGSIMEPLALLPLAAAGYSLIYLLCGGGFGGAVVIFVVAKMLGK